MTDTLKELDEVIADNPDTDSAIGAYEIANVVRMNLHTIRAALELKARVDAGWVLVPTEPTTEMVSAAYMKDGTYFTASDIYRAMIKAVQKESEDDAR